MAAISDGRSFILSNDPKHELSRLSSFGIWKEELSPRYTKGLLAKHGMHYDREDNKVKCVGCQFQIELWSSDINPIHRHIEMSPKCQYTSQQKNLLPTNGMFQLFCELSKIKCFSYILRSVNKIYNT